MAVRFMIRLSAYGVKEYIAIILGYYRKIAIVPVDKYADLDYS